MVDGLTLKGFTIDQVNMIETVFKENGYALTKKEKTTKKVDDVEYQVISKDGSRVNITKKSLINQISNKRTPETTALWIKELDDKGIKTNNVNGKTYKKLEKVKK